MNDSDREWKEMLRETRSKTRSKTRRHKTKRETRTETSPNARQLESIKIVERQGQTRTTKERQGKRQGKRQ